MTNNPESSPHKAEPLSIPVTPEYSPITHEGMRTAPMDELESFDKGKEVQDLGLIGVVVGSLDIDGGHGGSHLLLRGPRGEDGMGLSLVSVEESDHGRKVTVEQLDPGVSILVGGGQDAEGRTSSVAEVTIDEEGSIQTRLQQEGPLNIVYPTSLVTGRKHEMVPHRDQERSGVAKRPLVRTVGLPIPGSGNDKPIVYTKRS